MTSEDKPKTIDATTTSRKKGPTIKANPIDRVVNQYALYENEIVSLLEFSSEANSYISLASMIIPFGLSLCTSGLLFGGTNVTLNNIGILVGIGLASIGLVGLIIGLKKKSKAQRHIDKILKQAGADPQSFK